MSTKYKEFIRLFAKLVSNPSKISFNGIRRLVKDGEIATAIIYLSGFCASKTEPKDWKELAKK